VWADALAGAVRLTAEWAEAVVGASLDGSPRTQALRALSVDPQPHNDTHTHARTDTDAGARTRARTRRSTGRDRPRAHRNGTETVVGGRKCCGAQGAMGRVHGRTSGCVRHRSPHAAADAPGAHGRSDDHNGDDAAAVRWLQPEWDSCEVRRRRRGRSEVAAAPAPSVLPYPESVPLQLVFLNRLEIPKSTIVHRACAGARNADRAQQVLAGGVRKG
jgi:hypothetical protein